MKGFLQIGNQQNLPFTGISSFFYSVSLTPPETPGVENQVHFVCKNPVGIYLGWAFTTGSQVTVNRLYVTSTEDSPTIPINSNLYVRLGQAYLASRGGSGPAATDRIAAYVFQNGAWVQFSEAAS